MQTTIYTVGQYVLSTASLQAALGLPSTSNITSAVWDPNLGQLTIMAQVLSQPASGTP